MTGVTNLKTRLLTVFSFAALCRYLTAAAWHTGNWKSAMDTISCFLSTSNASSTPSHSLYYAIISSDVAHLINLRTSYISLHSHWNIRKNSKKYMFNIPCHLEFWHNQSSADIKFQTCVQNLSYLVVFAFFYFFYFFVGPRPSLWSHWLVLFLTLCVLPHGFQIQSWSLTCTLSSLRMVIPKVTSGATPAISTNRGVHCIGMYTAWQPSHSDPHTCSHRTYPQALVVSRSELGLEPMALAGAQTHDLPCRSTVHLTARPFQLGFVLALSSGDFPDLCCCAVGCVDPSLLIISFFLSL